MIATKGGLVRPGPNRWDADGRPEHLREVCEGSLRRLRLEQIPLYQFHRPDPKVPLAESVGALAETKDEGKIRHVGLSNVTESQLPRGAADRPDRVDAEQVQRDRPAVGVADRPVRAGSSMVFLPWAPIQQTDQRARRWPRPPERHGVTQHQVVLAWLLAISPRSCPFPGTGSPEHAEENVAATAIELTRTRSRRSARAGDHGPCLAPGGCGGKA